MNLSKCIRPVKVSVRKNREQKEKVRGGFFFFFSLLTDVDTFYTSFVVVVVGDQIFAEAHMERKKVN